jgi:uncharacterized protein YbaR (Trm112 family)
VSLDATLLSILACPEDKGPLYYIDDEDVLVNPRLRRTYQVRDGIPVMLVEEAVALTDDEFDRLAEIITDRSISPTFGA